MITRWNIRASISTTIIFVGMMLCASANAQNSNLPPCPKGQGVVLNDCFGTLTLTDGRKYTGEFKNGKRNGQGTTIFPNGELLNTYFLVKRTHAQNNFDHCNSDLCHNSIWAIS
jgi:hypothetical protein